MKDNANLDDFETIFSDINVIMKYNTEYVSIAGDINVDFQQAIHVTPSCL